VFSILTVNIRNTFKIWNINYGIFFKNYFAIVFSNNKVDLVRLVKLCLSHQPTLLAAISVAPWVGSHKPFELLHIGNTLDILFLLEPLLDGWSIEIQSVTLADKRNVVTPDRSVHRRFGFAK
jgi:hypothetical protein